MDLPKAGEPALVVNADGHKGVATRVRAAESSQMWDTPSGAAATVLDVWAECELKTERGFVKAKHCPGLLSTTPAGTLLDVKDTDPQYQATFMRRRAEQSTEKANLACWVPNGEKVVTLLNLWVECRVGQQTGFIKARHVRRADAADAGAAPVEALQAGNEQMAAATTPGQICHVDMQECSSGIWCPDKEHFVCTECIVPMLEAFCYCEYADQKPSHGKLLCPFKHSEKTFDDLVLATVVPQELFDLYLKVRINVEIQMHQEEVKQQMEAQIAELKAQLAKATGSVDELEVEKHKVHILDEILLLKCPRCKTAFVDFDSCNALKCGSCPCAFCAHCLEDCGQDAHQHFYSNESKCPKSGEPLFGNFEKSQRIRREKLFYGYLLQVPEALRQRVVDATAHHAHDLGIQVPADLSEGGLLSHAGNCKMKLAIPRNLRKKLAAGLGTIQQNGVRLRIPGPEDFPKLEEPGPWPVLKIPGDMASKTMELRPDQHVRIMDDWVKCESTDLPEGWGWIKTKHLVGDPQVLAKLPLEEASGQNASCVRREALPQEGSNVIAYLKDGTLVKVNENWLFVVLQGAERSATHRGFLHASHVLCDDVILQGVSEEECQAALQRIWTLMDGQHFPFERI